MNLLADSTFYTSELVACTSKNSAANTSHRSRQPVSHSYVKFRLGYHLLLLPIHQVAKTVTVSLQSISPTSCMPPTMLGLVNYQNQMLWVTDLARLLGLSTNQCLERSCNLVLLQFKHVLLGLRVQAIIEDVFTTAPAQLQTIPGVSTQAGIG
ncbi:MAG: chemotaxis protein CheW [Leptolyngbyaceae cyanobacterium]